MALADIWKVFRFHRSVERLKADLGSAPRETAKSEASRLADAEMRAVKAAIENVFLPNLFEVSQKVDVASFHALMARPTDLGFGCVNDLFLYGVVSEVVRGLPALPTDPATRTYLHLLNRFIDEETSVEKGQQRLAFVKSQIDTQSEWTKWIVEMGRTAAQSKEASVLSECQQTVSSAFQS